MTHNRPTCGWMVALFLILTCTTSVSGSEYPFNPAVPLEHWEKIEPYFLPPESKTRGYLDKLFSKKRVTKNLHSLLNAGFRVIPSTGYSGLVVVRHKKLKGYVLKIFTDDSPLTDTDDRLIWRIKGAEFTKDVIARQKVGHLFKVPDKWIYPIPLQGNEENGAKHFILIAKDLKLVDEFKNYKSWGSDSKITPYFLKVLFLLLQEAGLSDSVYPFNLPFSTDGKIAIIDTEYHHCWPVHFQRLTKKNQYYWTQLINNGDVNW